MKQEYINEFSWVKIFKFLNEAEAIYVCDEKNCKRFLEAVFWMMRTGAQWRELPDKYGKWNSVFSRFNDWSKKGVWSALHEFCTEGPDLESIMIDATIMRAHACAAGYKKGQQAEEGLGRSKGGFTTKVHVKVDALGNPLKFINTPGQVADITQANALIEGDKESNIIADKGYDSDEFRAQTRNQECTPVIPFRSNRKSPGDYDKHIYKDRNLIECFMGKIKHFRRIFSRFDKSKRNFMSFLSFAGAILWLR